MAATFANAVPQWLRAVLEISSAPSFWARMLFQLLVAVALYVSFGVAVHARFPRSVPRNVFGPSWNSDLGLALISLVSGTPIVAGEFGCFGWGIMLAYNDVAEHGWVWWAVSIPVYLLLWDAVFYCLHLVLHMEPVYSISHANHHAFRPPVAWSGIAIDPIENIFSGLGPYLVPLFILPFHLPTVYVINVLLVGWALLLHSSCPWGGNWLLVGTVTHNMHHASGIKNGNYGALTKLFDRAFGTLLPEDARPFWMKAEASSRLQAAEAAAAAAAAATAASLHAGGNGSGDRVNTERRRAA